MCCLYFSCAFANILCINLSLPNKTTILVSLSFVRIYVHHCGYLCTELCTYIYVHIYIYTHTFMHTYIHGTYMHTNIHSCIHTHIYSTYLSRMVLIISLATHSTFVIYICFILCPIHSFITLPNLPVKATLY